MKPARLEKKENYSQWDMFCKKYSHLLVFFLIFLLIAMIIALIVACVDISSAHNVAMLDSGNYYNHLKDVI